MSLITMMVKKVYLLWMKQKGLNISKNCRIMGLPNFGSEPYLIKIGDNVTISNNVRFINHDGGTFVFRNQEKYKNVIKFGKIEIKDNCFIGANTIILPGVTVSENCVIGCGSIVTKDIAPNSVVAGNPTKVIMSTHEYAEKCYNIMPEYDVNNFKANKRRELFKICK